MKMNTPEHHIRFKKGLLLAVCCGFLILCFGPPAFSSETIQKWQTITTNHVVIHFQEAEDLKTFNAKIAYDTESQNHDPELAITGKVDAIFTKTQDLLEMHGVVNKINIRLFKNSRQLDQAYLDLFQKPRMARGWYSHHELTIYLQLEDVHAMMLAHEIAHAIIDHYLIVPPPQKTAEILARHVGSHFHNPVFSENTPSGLRTYSEAQ